MPTYKVLVHGRGLETRRWWIFTRRLGFYATHYVDAETVEDATARALQAVRGEPRLALTAIRAPSLTIEEVESVEGPANAWSQLGIVFYEARADAKATTPVT